MGEILVGDVRIGEAEPLAGGRILAHTFSFLHHRASGRYLAAWGESVPEGPSRILLSGSDRLFEGWSEPRELFEAQAPVQGMQLSSSGGTQVPRLFLSYKQGVSHGVRVPMDLLYSDDGGRTWDGPHTIRYDEPHAMGGQVPPLEPSGGPGTEHLLSHFVPVQPELKKGRPANAWALVATDRFLEWSLGLRPWQPTSDSPRAYGALWGATIYLGIRHHMPLPAYLAEDRDGTLCVVYLRTPSDYPSDAARPQFPQAHVVRLDMDAILRDSDKDGEQDLEDFLLTRYHTEDLYRLWLQCRVDGREMQRRPFISGVRKVLKLSKGLIVQVPRPLLRAGTGIPRNLLLAGRGIARPVSLQDVASSKAPRYMQDRGKDRYPESQGFQLVPGDVTAEDVRPGMVLVSPGWGHPARRFTAELEIPPTTKALPEKALFHFWSYNFPGAIVETMPPDPGTEENVSCRVVVELDEEVVLEDGLPFPILAIEAGTGPDRSPEIVGYDDSEGPTYRLVALGRVSGLPSTPRGITPLGVL